MSLFPISTPLSYLYTIPVIFLKVFTHVLKTSHSTWHPMPLHVTLEPAMLFWPNSWERCSSVSVPNNKYASKNFSPSIFFDTDISFFFLLLLYYFKKQQLILCICVHTVYLETVVTPYSHKMRVNSCFAIGFAYFIVHVVLITIDGCGVNPARSLGPAVLSKARNCDNFKTGPLKVT